MFCDFLRFFFVLLLVLVSAERRCFFDFETVESSELSFSETDFLSSFSVSFIFLEAVESLELSFSETIFSSFFSVFFAFSAGLFSVFSLDFRENQSFHLL